MGGMTEVQLGKLAAEKGSTDAVKQFGQKMVDDHSKADDELKQVASQRNITLPDSLDSRHQARIDKLSKLSGTAFDRAYVKDQMKDHEQDVREFQTEAQNGSDPAVKDFASKTLPTIQEHLSMAKDLNKSNSSTSMNRPPSR
jgi:putative membrane protein